MFSIVINEKGGQPRVIEFDKGEVTIGRVAGNDIVLPKGNISKRHSRIVQKDGKFIIVDLKSTNGTYVNGKKITSPQVIKETDKVYIGDFTLGIEMAGAGNDGGDATVGATASPRGAKAPLPGGKAPPPPAENFDEDDEQDEPQGTDFGDEQGGDGEGPGEDYPGGEQDADGDGEEPVGSEPFEEDFEQPAEEEEEEAPPPPPPPPPPAPARPVAKPTPPPPAPPPRAAPPPPEPPKPAAKPIIKAAPAAPPPKPEPPKPEPPKPEPPKAAPPPAAAARPAARPAAPSRTRDQEASLQRAALVARDLYDALTIWLSEQGVDTAVLPDDELRERVQQGLQECGDKVVDNLPKGVKREDIEALVEREVMGLGPLDDLLADDEIEEIFINGPHYLAVTRGGTPLLLDAYFSSETTLTLAVERLLLRTGIRMTEDTTVVDARLKDGGRLHAVLQPVAPRGPVVTWRRGGRGTLSVDDLAANGTLTQGLVEFLETCVSARRNVVVAGPAGAGKTTLLGALGCLVPDHERLVTVEEAAEVTLPQPQVVNLETCPPRPDGSGGVDLAALVRSALRMRPDRLVVGECRGGEALPLLQGMSAGQDGTMLTMHAHSARDCLARLEMMVLMGGQDLPIKAVRELIATAVDVIIVLTRFPDDSRHVTHVCEVSGMEVDIVTTQDVFTSRREGEDGAPGKLLATGFVPRFYEQLQQRGMNPNLGIFREDG